jgi:Protein of unknown function (DUF2846)
LPPVAKGKGRVFVYRPTVFGFAIKPSVRIDEKVVGTSEGKGFFYSDQTAGKHEISIVTEYNHKNTINVAAGKSNFVKCHVTPGGLVAHVIPNQVGATEGESGIQSCKMSAQ